MRSVLLAVLISATLVTAARADYHIVSKIQVGGDTGWDYLEADAVGRRLYVTHKDHVVVIDMDQLTVVGDVPDSPGMGGVAIARDLNRGFTANGAEDMIGVFELDTLKPIAKWKATGHRPNQIAYEPVTQRVFSFNSTGRNVTVFDARTGAVLATLDVDGRTEFYALDGKGMIYDSLEDKATVIAIDARSMKVTATYSVAPNEEPAGTVMDPLARRIFVACHNKKFLVLNADTGKILASFPIGAGNDAAKFDPALKLAFASNGDGTLAVLHEDGNDKFSLVQTVTTEPGARTMAVDAKTHRLFLPAAEFLPAPAPTAENPKPRGKMVPGSFHVLVMEP